MVLLHVETRHVELVHYTEEQYSGEPRAMGRWVEKDDHLEVKQKKKMMKYPRLMLKPEVEAGKSEPHEDEPANCPPCQSPRLICCSKLHGPVSHTFDTCGYDC